jgi:hypothetical protein
MEFIQDGKKLSGTELEAIIAAQGDPQAENLLRKSELDETLGLLEMGSSFVLGTATLLCPNDHIHVVGINISTPFLPLAVPGMILGFAGGLHLLESSTSKYAAVQRYNRQVSPGSVSWNFLPEKNGLGLQISRAF